MGTSDGARFLWMLVFDRRIEGDRVDAGVDVGGS